MRADAAIANAAWLAASLPERLRFDRAASQLEATQRRRLAWYLDRNAGTEFGMEHDFAGIRCWETYAERVPARSYDEFRPWIERVAAGVRCVLTADTVRLLEPTSGSSGAEKWVPYTRTLQAEFHRAVATWITGLFLARPGLMGGRAYWSVTPQVERASRSTTGVPVGFDEDSAYLGSLTRHLVNATMATSAELKRIRDMDVFWKMTLLELLRARDLRLVSVWHPSYLSLLLEHLRRDWTELLAALYQGVSISTPRLRVAADPARARELERLGPANASAIWPALELISCWGDAHAAGGLEDILAAFPGIHLQPKGLVATEAFISLPLADLHPLAARSHFFEFRDEGGAVHPAWLLEEGKIYSVIVTTGGGLYRYELCDLVEVTGFYRDVPSLRFVGRADNVSDYCGEKLNENFVAASIEAVRERHKLAPAFAMLALDAGEPVPGYTLYIEAASPLAGELGPELDAELRRNPHYELCVRLGQLRPVRIFELAPGAYETYTRVLADQGMRLGDIKPAVLSRFTGWSQHFRAHGRP